MKTDLIAKKFEAMGARLKVEHDPRDRWGRTTVRDYAVDIVEGRKGETFVLRFNTEAESKLDLFVQQLDRHDRHLLLMVRNEEEDRLDRFLCGHDERHWFVAAVPGGASSILQAKEALKPREVRGAQHRHALNKHQAQRRHNAAFRRQGEWFFVPVSHGNLDDAIVHRNEPLRRGGGKPHLVEELARTGGTKVMVCRKYPNGLTIPDYEKLLATDANAKNFVWRQMTRDAGVFVRGRVRHPDHATIVLHGWHRVYVNEEHRAPVMASASMAFLD